MEYAVITTGGKQYLAAPGKNVIVESLPQAEGETVVFEQVLLSVDGADVKVGLPFINGLTVSGTVVKQQLGEKLRVFKYRPKSRYRRTMGHRQKETVVRIDAIGSKSIKATNPKPDTRNPAPEATKPATRARTKKAETQE